MRTRLLVACVAVATALAGVGGCSSGAAGSSGASGSKAGAHAARTSPASATPTTVSPESVRITSLMRKLAAWTDAKHSVTATEIVVFDAHSLRYDGLFAWGSGPAMDVRAPTAQLGLRQLHAADKTEVLLAGGSYYYRVDARSGGPSKGRPWLRTSLPRSADADVAAAHGIQGNPESALLMLPDAGGWTDLGTDATDGTTTSHYQGTVTRAALAADSRLLRTGGLSPSALLGAADSAEIDVWVDAHGKPVRFVEMSMIGRSLAIDFLSFGASHPLTPPPPATTTTSDDSPAS